MKTFTVVICAILEDFQDQNAEDTEVRKGWSMFAGLTLTAETVKGTYIHKLLCLNL